MKITSSELIISELGFFTIYINIFCKKLKYEIKPNFAKDRIKPPLVIFSEFLKKNTTTGSSLFLSPNGQGFYMYISATNPKIIPQKRVDQIFHCLILRPVLKVLPSRVAVSSQ